MSLQNIHIFMYYIEEIPFSILLIAYLIGSIPFGLILGKLFGIGDIRNVGSGNIGATNMLRAGGKWLGLATLLLDMLKGGIFLYFVIDYEHYYQAVIDCAGPCPTPYIDAAALIMLTTLIGHMYPIWLKFKGGKGVASMLGIYIALSFAASFYYISDAFMWLGIIAVTAWIVAFYITRISSIGGLTAAWAPALFLLAIDTLAIIGFTSSAIIIACLVTFKHRDNIKRLRLGEEPKVSFGKKG